MKPVYFFIVCFIFFVVPVSAQKVYSLEDCFELAKEYNYIIRQSKNETALAAIDRKSASYKLAPTLAINADHIFSTGKSIDPVTNTFVNDDFSGGSLSADAVLDIFGGLRKMHNIQQAMYVLRSKEQAGKKMELETLSAIATAYANVLYTNERISLLRSNNHLTKNELAVTEEKINVGKISRGEYYVIDARYNNEKADIAAASGDSVNVLLELLNMLSLTNTDSFRVAHSDDASISMLLKKEIIAGDITMKVLQSHPVLQEDMYAIKAVESSLKLAKANKWPMLSLESSLISNYNVSYKDVAGGKIPVKQQLKNNFGSYTGIVLQVPLFQQMSSSMQVRKEKIILNNVKLELKQKQAEVSNHIQQLVNSFYVAKERYALQQEALRQGEKSYKIAEEKHRLGMADAMNLIIAKNYLFDLQLKYLDSKYELYIADKLIELLTEYTN